jgi:hypothetical protein
MIIGMWHSIYYNDLNNLLRGRKCTAMAERSEEET